MALVKCNGPWIEVLIQGDVKYDPTEVVSGFMDKVEWMLGEYVSTLNAAH